MIQASSSEGSDAESINHDVPSQKVDMPGLYSGLLELNDLLCIMKDDMELLQHDLVACAPSFPASTAVTRAVGSQSSPAAEPPVLSSQNMLQAQFTSVAVQWNQNQQNHLSASPGHEVEELSSEDSNVFEAQRRVRARRGGNLTQTPSRRRSNRERRPAARVDV